MEFENKVLSKELLSMLYESGKSCGTAESCTAGMVSHCISAVPGASNYFKGGIVCYSDEVKTNILKVSAEVIEEKTAVCEEVAVAMVKGAIESLDVDYAVAVTGYAGPSGGPSSTPVGTIWLACGNKDEQQTLMINKDDGRELNVLRATHKALQMLVDFVKAHEPQIDCENIELIAE